MTDKVIRPASDLERIDRGASTRQEIDKSIAQRDSARLDLERLVRNEATRNAD